MAFKESTTVSHPPTEVFAGLINREFQQHVAQDFHATVEAFQVEPASPSPSDTVNVQIQRSIDGAQVADRLPSAVQRFVKGRVQIEQVETWSAAADNGARDAKVTIKVPLAKATGTATMQLTPTADGAGTQVEISGSVKSTIPLMGSKIAEMAEPQVGKLLTGMTRKLDSWLNNQQ